ncbi:YqgE/AlgH family protein [Egicoccus sp. AB-alg2]|uniref:YqgE/AlgH family protein n=1 Tax=Egicoccus sp. AB-alg2 TaxID=3242693 RepID=UPI00359D50D4
MHDWQTGRLLVATPALEDPNFARSVVLVLDHDDDGALGVVLNRASDLAVDDTLTGWSDLVASPPVVFGGGPVEPTAVVALGRAHAAVPADEGFSTRLDRVRLVDLADDPVLAATDLERVRVFAGYAGWGPGQLESEIDAGAWFTVDAEPTDVFTHQPDRLWQAVLRRQRDELALFSTFPADPSLN